MLQNILFEVERYKRQKCQDSDLVYYTRLKELQHEEDWDIKQKLTVVNGFWRETIFLWNKVTPYWYWNIMGHYVADAARDHAEAQKWHCITLHACMPYIS